MIGEKQSGDPGKKNMQGDQFWVKESWDKDCG